MYISSSDLELSRDSEFNKNQYVGLRFTNVALPRCASIESATVEFTVDYADTEQIKMPEVDVPSVSIWIRGEKPLSGNAAAFTSTSFNLSSRPTTTNFALWISSPKWTTTGVGAKQYDSPDISLIIQEIVHLNNWNSGNALVIRLDGDGSLGVRIADACESFSCQYSPKLKVWYRPTPCGP